MLERSHAAIPKGLTRNEDHRYFFNGAPVPGVTSLLKDYGLINFDGIPEERIEFKRGLGTAVDYACHLFDVDDLDWESVDSRIKPYVDAYIKFREMTDFDPRFSRLMLYSKIWRFAGELDKQGPMEWKGRIVEALIDIKCVWAMYPATAIQTAGYEILFNENFPEIKNRKRLGVQLKENGNYDIVEYNNVNDRNTFLSTVWLHHWRRENRLIK